MAAARLVRLPSFDNEDRNRKCERNRDRIPTGKVLREESVRFPEFAGEGAVSAADAEGRARRLGFDDLDMAPRYDTAGTLFYLDPPDWDRTTKRHWHNVPETCEIFRRFAIETKRYTVSGGKWSDVTEIVPRRSRCAHRAICCRFQKVDGSSQRSLTRRYPSRG